TFGVMTSTSGISLSRRNATPFLSSNSAPEDDRMTGSSRTFDSRRLPRKSAIASATSAEPSIPILTAANWTSAVSVARVSVSVLADNGSTLDTPWVLWTVRAVMQVTPKHPWAAMVLMSAVIPAPEDGSYPDMLSTIGLLSGMAAVYTQVWIFQ